MSYFESKWTWMFVLQLAGLAVGAGSLIYALFHLFRYPYCCGVYKACHVEDLPTTCCHRLHHFILRFLYGIVNCFVVVLLIVYFSCFLIPFWILSNLYFRCLCTTTKESGINLEKQLSVVEFENDFIRKKVAIIGCGPSGIITAKILADYGHDVTIFEKSDLIGGTFAQLSYENGSLTSSNLHTSFSMFEFDKLDLIENKDRICYQLKNGKTVPANMQQVGFMPTFNEYCKYLTRFCKTFHLTNKIRFKHEITNITYTDHNENENDSKDENEYKMDSSEKRFKIEFINRNSDDDNVRSDYFDHFVVCTGIASIDYANMPNECEQMKSCNIIHSSQYKTANDERIKDKNVLIIGCGESGSDISYFVSKTAKKCVLMCRNGPGALLPRYAFGQVADIGATRSAFRYVLLFMMKRL